MVHNVYLKVGYFLHQHRVIKGEKFGITLEVLELVAKGCPVVWDINALIQVCLEVLVRPSLSL